MLMHAGTECRRRLQVDHSCGAALCRLVGGWRSWRGLAGQGVPAQEAGGASDPDRPGPRRGIDPAAGFSDSRGSCLPRVTMTRGSFEAWMKRLVCLWGVWCRLKEFPEPWTCPSQAERERQSAPSGGWYEGMHNRHGITAVQDCGRPALCDYGGWVWGCANGRRVGWWAAGLSFSVASPSLPTASCAPCGVAPSTAATEQEGWFPGRPCPACRLRAGLRTCVHVCMCVCLGRFRNRE